MYFCSRRLPALVQKTLPDVHEKVTNNNDTSETLHSLSRERSYSDKNKRVFQDENVFSRTRSIAFNKMLTPTLRKVVLGGKKINIHSIII